MDSIHLFARYASLIRVNPLELKFNPSYSAVIGGRGSGKSTIVECLRLSLAQENEINGLKDSEIKRTFEAFK